MKWICVAVPVLLFIGCSKTEPEGTPVARLDNQTLSLEEIRARIDTMREPSQAQIQQYIQRWLTEESLYREARERGFDQSDDIQEKMDHIRRQLAISALLEQEVYSQQLSNISPEEIRKYYETRIKEFTLTRDQALLSYVLFRNRDEATEFRNLILRGASWSQVVGQKSNTILFRVDSSYQTQTTLMPPELWRVASNSAPRELSFPINTKNGYYILVVWKYLLHGQIADLQIVEQEIRSRLTVERRQKLYDQLVEALRAKHAIEVFPPPIDTAK